METKHVGTFQSLEDLTSKSVYKNEKGYLELSLIQNKTDLNLDVFCAPTHYYCNLGCKMCHLTNEKYAKSMLKINPNELMDSIIKTNDLYKKRGRTQNDDLLLSYMGVGEPLLNLDLIQNIFENENLLKKETGYKNLTYALSTMMPNKNLEKITQYANKNNFPLKVHFSLHSPFDKERNLLIPNSNLSVRDSFELLSQYRESIKDNSEIKANLGVSHYYQDPIEIHYTLIKGKNDSNKHLEETMKLIDEFQIPFKILSFNPHNKLKKSKREKEWINELELSLPNIPITLYNPPGRDVGSSCGEFTKHYYLSELETKREKRKFNKWKKKHQIF